MVNNNGIAEVYQVYAKFRDHTYMYILFIVSVYIQWNTEHGDWIKVRR